MFDLNEPCLLAFRDELRKEAGALTSFAGAVARNTPRLKNVGALMGAGSLVGAAGGAALGGVQGYQAARGQGASVGQAALGGLGGAGTGALKGGLIGGAVGAGGGALLHPGVDASRLTTLPGIGVGARFGQRQLHGFTGMLSPMELEAVRGGAHGLRQGAAEAAKAVGAARPMGGPALAKAEAVAAKAQQGLRASEAVTGVAKPSMNLTSIPGYLNAVGEHGAHKVLRAGLKEQLTGGGALMGGLLGGAPLRGAAQAARSPDQVDAQGRGKGERLGEQVGQAVGGVAGGVMPIIGQAAVGGALGAAGRRVGRVVDRLRGVRGRAGMAPATLEPAESQNTPSERVTSPAAAGQQPDIGI